MNSEQAPFHRACTIEPVGLEFWVVVWAGGSGDELLSQTPARGVVAYTRPLV